MKTVLGVTGSIAAYKAAEVVRRLRERGDEVRVVFSRSAEKFVAPLTFSSLSGNSVLADMFAPSSAVEHVALAGWAEMLIVAPASADAIAKLAHGIADDPLTTYALAHSGPILLAPAMETAMWEHPAVAGNVRVLRDRGVRFVGPAAGPLASGRSGTGRMAEPEEIVEAAMLRAVADLAGIRVLVTAGPTREPIDTIRFVSNRSSGKMGHALAERARARGAEVVLLTGTDRPAPPGVVTARFETAADLKRELDARFAACDVLVMAAAVADFVPERAPRRLHRSDGPRSLSLSPGEDVLAGVAARKGDRIVVAFAAETGDGQEERVRK
ncbi:MAG TPA: bifunctional phosphopantothenoylcysteine decarboxylase/phosphopantothenate--cysteine ligase CoaBC, partial [Thermoanaerobaculia bacterium]|nr:bifunctional phosphopantothenoylcysteine decarboxylase/phosphopantothenate--cysteine ligase CoaBC [Thermoanaerobaculia bacterium]